MKTAVSTLIRRIIIYGTCYLALIVLTAVAVFEEYGPISGGPSYSINDLQHVEKSLQNYYIEVFSDGKPIYPASLEDLVSRHYMTQEQLNRFGSEYFVDYYHPPLPDISGDPILFRALQKMPVITYSVSGRMRMEAPTQPVSMGSPTPAPAPAAVESTPPVASPAASDSSTPESSPSATPQMSPASSPAANTETTPPQPSATPSSTPST